MAYGISWLGQPQETRAVFSGITMLWKYLVFFYNFLLFHFELLTCLLLTCLQSGWILQFNCWVTEIMKKSEMSSWLKPSKWFRPFFISVKFSKHFLSPLIKICVQLAFLLSLRTVVCVDLYGGTLPLGSFLGVLGNYFWKGEISNSQCFFKKPVMPCSEVSIQSMVLLGSAVDCKQVMSIEATFSHGG